MGMDKYYCVLIIMRADYNVGWLYLGLDSACGLLLGAVAWMERNNVHKQYIVLIKIAPCSLVQLPMCIYSNLDKSR